jgi:hypothetical protein
MEVNAQSMRISYKTVPDTPQANRPFRRCGKVGENGINVDVKETKSRELNTTDLNR